MFVFSFSHPALSKGVVTQGWQADPNTRMVMPKKPGRWQSCSVQLHQSSAQMGFVSVKMTLQSLLVCFIRHIKLMQAAVSTLILKYWLFPRISWNIWFAPYVPTAACLLFSLTWRIWCCHIFTSRKVMGDPLIWGHVQRTCWFMQTYQEVVVPSSSL